MIQIINDGPVEGADEAGIHVYVILLNNQFVSKFVHKRADGLSKLLERASVVARILPPDASLQNRPKEITLTLSD